MELNVETIKKILLLFCFTVRMKVAHMHVSTKKFLLLPNSFFYQWSSARNSHWYQHRYMLCVKLCHVCTHKNYHYSQISLLSIVHACLGVFFCTEKRVNFIVKSGPVCVWNDDGWKPLTKITIINNRARDKKKFVYFGLVSSSLFSANYIAWGYHHKKQKKIHHHFFVKEQKKIEKEIIFCSPKFFYRAKR